MQLNKKLRALESKLQNFTRIDSSLPSLGKTKSNPEIEVKSIDLVTENTSTSSKKSDSTKKSLVDLGIGNFTYENKNSNFNYDLDHYEPVDT